LDALNVDALTAAVRGPMRKADRIGSGEQHYIGTVEVAAWPAE
jgi:hypothetical protein